MAGIADLFTQIEKAVADLDAKKKVADDLSRQASEANTALSNAEVYLEGLRNKVHDILGEKTTRVRKF